MIFGNNSLSSDPCCAKKCVVENGGNFPVYMKFSCSIILHHVLLEEK